MLRPAHVLVVALLCAGCAGARSGPGSSAAPLVLDDATGAVRGIVTDDSLAPIAGALVGLLGQGASTTTDDAGRYQLGGLRPGPDRVQVIATGYGTFVKAVTIEAGRAVDVNAQLAAIPIVEPYHVTHQKAGKIFCGAGWRLPPPQGNGFFAACGAVYNTPLSNLDSFVVDFDLSSNNISQVATLMFETQWRPTQTFGSGLSIFWEVHQNITPAYSFTEPLRTFLQLRGSSPLHGTIDQTGIQTNVTHYKPPPQFCRPDGPCKFWGRASPYASTFGPSSPVDFAFYTDQTYTHYVSEFYGDPAPEGFTALGDS